MCAKPFLDFRILGCGPFFTNTPPYQHRVSRIFKRQASITLLCKVEVEMTGSLCRNRGPLLITGRGRPPLCTTGRTDKWDQEVGLPSKVSQGTQSLFTKLRRASFWVSRFFGMGALSTDTLIGLKCMSTELEVDTGVLDGLTVVTAAVTV